MSGHQEEMVALARALYGEPVNNSKTDMRFKKNEAFSLNQEKEAFCDFQTGDQGGFRQLYKLVHGHFPEEEGSARQERPRPKTGNGNGGATVQQVEERWEPIVPPPPDCKPPTEEQLRCSKTYEYVSPEGLLLFYQRRYEATEGRRKRFAPLTYGRLWHGELFVEGWHAKGPNAPRPLYRLDALTQADSRTTILLCEGEKATEAAERLFPRMVAVCWMNGEPGVEHADLSPLEGRDIIIWPDADEGGVKATAKLREKLKHARVLNTKDLPNGFDAADLEELGIDDLDAWLHARVPEPPDPIHQHKLPEIPWKWERGSDWANAEVPERQWILPGWIPRRQTTGLYGVGGVNKTDFLLQLAMAHSKGLVFAGHQLPKGRVVCLFCEDESEEIRRRANRVARHYGFYDIGDFQDFHYVSLVGYDLPYFLRFKGSKPKPQTALKRADKKIKDEEATLMVLDTAPHFFGGNDISRLEVSTFLRKLDGISLARDCAVLFAAHPSKSGEKSGRMTSGSTHWEGGVRARISLTRPEEEGDESKPPSDTSDRILTLWKSNYAAPGKTLDLVWNDGVFTTSALDPEKAKARGPQRNEACEEKFLELLRKISEQGRYVNDASTAPARYAPKAFASMPEGKTYSAAEYKRAMERLLGTGKIRVERGSRLTKLIEVTT